MKKQLAKLQESPQPTVAWNNIQSYPQPYKEMARAAFAEERITIPQFVQDIRGDQKILMGSHESNGFLRVLNPVGVVVESTHPTFHWNGISEATYVVRIYDSQYNAVTSSSVLSETTWTSVEPLRRGGIYVWNVTAIVGNREIRAPVPPSPEAKFQILDERKLIELDTIRAQYPNSGLLLGLVYTNLGLMNEAVQEFKELKEKNPDSKLAQKLFLSIRDFNWEISENN